MKRLGVLALAAAALASGRAVAAADDRWPDFEEARPAVYTGAAAQTEARPVQYVYAPYGYTWYGANSYAYVPPSYYVTPNYDYSYSPYDSGYGASWRTSYYSPGTYGSTSYRPYHISHGPVGYSYGWLPYDYQTRPYGSFYRYYGPVYGSGFHLWFGY